MERRNMERSVAGKDLEDLPGSKSVVRPERDARNLGGSRASPQTARYAGKGLTNEKEATRWV